MDVAPRRRSSDLSETSTTSTTSDDSTMSSDSSVAKSHTSHKKLRVIDLSWLMLTDIVGTGVLTLAKAAADLGWVWVIVIITLMCPVAIYSAVMMVRARTLLVGAGRPPPKSMGHATSVLFNGNKCLVRCVYTIVYGYALLGNASYLLVIGTSLQGALFTVLSEICLPTVAISCVVLLPLVVGMRWLEQSVWLCLINMIILLAAIATVVAGLVSEERSSSVSTHLFAPDLSVMAVFGATSNIVYAYTGHWMYFELMDELKHPHEFPKTFILNGPVMVVVYVSVAAIGYYYFGDCAPGNFVDATTNVAFRTSVETMLFVHVCIVYMLKSIVLSHFFHSVASPKRVEEKSSVAHAQYAGFAIAMLAFGFVFANSIPFFNDMLGCVGKTLAPSYPRWLPN